MPTSPLSSFDRYVSPRPGSEPAATRIVIVDGQALFRQGLHALLRLSPDAVVVAETERLDGLAATLRDLACDVVLLDAQMPGAVAAIPGLALGARVVALTADEHCDSAVAALRAGARGVVLKRFAVERLLDALRVVMDGHVWLPPPLQARLTDALQEADRQRLTPREIEVVRHVGMGLKNADIARRLFISEETVKAHLTRVFGKLGVRDRVELTLHALRVGLVGLYERPTAAAD